MIAPAELESAKSKTTIVEELQRRGIPMQRRGSNFVARCPIHEEKSPSFTIFPDGKARCFGCDFRGDVLDVVMQLDGLSLPAAVEKLTGYPVEPSRYSARAMHSRPPSQQEREGSPLMPPDMHRGSGNELRRVAESRNLSLISVYTADRLGLLHFGTVCGFDCWILTDERRQCAEARRMDGELFPATHALGIRKVHTIKGSLKSWPVGICPAGFTIDQFRAIAIVEGGPDLLAALHFITAHRGDCLPIAMLGASASIAPQALRLLAGRRVRIFPHYEANSTGRNASERWAEQLVRVGCDVDCFNFEGLRRSTGEAAKDLNDLTTIDPSQAGELEDMLP